MKRILLPVVAAFALIGTPMLAATTTTNPCTSDIAAFDAAVKTTKAAKADVTKATKLRNKAVKLCKKSSSVKKGEADLSAAMSLIGAKG